MHTAFDEKQVIAINDQFQTLRPIQAKNIDFTNPYYTQPKTALTPQRAEHFLGLMQGTEIEHIYVHVPFCMTSCLYCHYPKASIHSTEEKQDLFLDTLATEIAYYRDKFDFSAVKTIHIGGGTPNMLNQARFERLLRIIEDGYTSSEEYAIEVYPAAGILTEDKFRLMEAYGVNRLSIGVQTFDDDINISNRRHHQPSSEVKMLVGRATESFGNISIDMLYGQKTQTFEAFMRDLEEADGLNVNSIYLYQTRELIKNHALDLQRALNAFLDFYKHRGYEVVSFDQIIRKRNSDGFCAHRSGRSKGESLLGIGPGAVSEIDSYIFKAVSPTEYGLRDGHMIDLGSVIEKTPEVLKREFFNRSLRHFNRCNVNGLLRRDYEKKFGNDIMDDLGETVTLLADEGLVKIDRECIEITDLGLLFTQQINYLLLEHFK